jgi:hypothetical protein
MGPIGCQLTPAWQRCSSSLTPKLCLLDACKRLPDKARIEFVKILGSFLILMIALHSACMAQCLGEGSHATKESTAPPCDHHQSGMPSGTDSSPTSATCSEGPALEAKTSPVVKCSLSPAAIPGPVTATVTCLDGFRLVTQESAGAPTSSLSVRLAVLRI